MTGHPERSTRRRSSGWIKSLLQDHRPRNDSHLGVGLPANHRCDMAVVHDGPSDFVFLTRDQSYIDMLDPRPDESYEILHYNLGADGQQPFPELAVTPYDSCPSGSAFPSHLSNGPMAPDTLPFKPKAMRELGQRPLPTASTPSPSVCQSSDHPPSTLSSASGASARSTTSSAVGSPYSHAASNIPGQEHWVNSPQGLGIAAGIVHSDGYGHDIYALTHLEHDLVLSGEKLSDHFVGELKGFPSSVSSSPCLSQTVVNPTAVAPLMLDTNVVTREITIDTIIREAKDGIEYPRCPKSPASGIVKHSLNWSQGITPTTSPSPSNRSFISPTTPASAFSPSTPSTTSPSPLRKHAFYKQSRIGGYEARTQGIPRRASGTSYRSSPYDQPLPSSKSPSHQYWDQGQASFFGQSSGRYIAPLECSCWFSLSAPSISSLSSLYLSFICF